MKSPPSNKIRINEILTAYSDRVYGETQVSEDAELGGKSVFFERAFRLFIRCRSVEKTNRTVMPFPLHTK